MEFTSFNLFFVKQEITFQFKGQSFYVSFKPGIPGYSHIYLKA
jgi:hypothetical protein